MDQEGTNLMNLAGWETEYSIINLNVSSMPVKIRFGFCLPASCSQDDMDGFASNVTSWLSNLLQAVIHSKLNP
jgi:hypothetical protein